MLESLGSLIPKPEFVPLLAGWEEFQRNGKALPDETVRVLKEECDAAMFGSVQSPSHKVPGYSSPIVALRKHLDLYANIRPVSSVPGTPGKDVNMVIVRENTECLYIKKEELRENADGSKTAIAYRQITSNASERVGRMAFELALRRGAERAAPGAAKTFWQGPPKVTIVHKSNVLSVTDGLFRESVRSVKENSGGRYDGVDMEEQLVDSMVYRMFREPEVFDVAVAPNLYGDIISDGAAALVGSLGLVPSVNAGDNFVMGEPVHGSAPDIAGKGLANPTALLLSSLMMLRHMGLNDYANKIETAALSTIAEGKTVTRDLGGNASTQQYTDAIIAKL